MPRSGSFLPVHSGLGMDVKSVFTKRAVPWNIVRALVQGDNTVQTQREQEWTRKSAISVRAAKISETVLSSKETVMLLLLNPSWPSMTLNHIIPSHLRALYMHNLGILTFHCTRTQLWNHAQNRCRLSPFQHKLTLSQKCQPSGRRSGEFFVRRRMMHGLLTSAAIPCEETSLLCCRLRVRAPLRSHTCGIFLVVF
jgi:hypothetical protein